jgi:small subunit ribosomal protein S19
MAKVITWKGKTEEEVKQLEMTEFIKLIPSRQRRSLTRGLRSQQQKKLLQKVETDDKNIKTHCRNMIITPSMLDKTIKIYNGKDYAQIIVTLEMIGHYLGEFSLTRKMVTHGSAGLGATRSSKGVSAK